MILKLIFPLFFLTFQGIFRDIYDAYLEGDLEKLEKTCSDQALGYFKAMLKKREADVMT